METWPGSTPSQAGAFSSPTRSKPRHALQDQLDRYKKADKSSPIFMIITRALIPEINPSKRGRLDFIVAVALLALFAATLHSLEALAWACLYVATGALPDVSDRNALLAQRNHQLWPRRSLSPQ